MNKNKKKNAISQSVVSKITNDGLSLKNSNRANGENADTTIHEAVKLDFEREKRSCFPEAVYGAGKTPEQVVKIFLSFVERNGKALATRCTPETLSLLRLRFPRAQINESAKIAWYCAEKITQKGKVAVLAAGTSDFSVAEEAAVTLEFSGFSTQRHYDIGVSGIHRVFNCLGEIRKADVVIVVAGMEGALPSVIGGLVAVPVIAVPTSIGYGASFQGLAALLSMLNSCAAGITVVNIDNGFGAAVAAVRILKGKSQ